MRPGRQRLRAVLDMQLAPNRDAWLMQSDGSYARAAADDRERGCQQTLLEWLSDELRTPTTGRKRRLPRRFARRAARTETV